MNESGPLLPQQRPGKVRPLKQFGRAAGKQVRQDLLHRVRTGDVQFARKLTHSRTLFVLRYAGEELAFIYSGATGRIVTFLPPGAPEVEDWRRSQAAARALFKPSDRGC